MQRLTHDHDDMKTMTTPTTKGWRSDVSITLPEASSTTEDPEHVKEWTQAAFPAGIDGHLAKKDTASKKQAAQRETITAEDMSEDSVTSR